MAKPQYNTPEDEVTFNLLDEHTVAFLSKRGNIKLAPKVLNIPKDKRWNMKQLQSRLLQGILNGDSISTIAKSFGEVILNNRASAIRNARTMTTGAENRGRLDSYKNLESQGVVQKKVWIATPDDRTRESHLEIDGEEVDINAEFSNGCRFPGDPNGPPEEVWNCRCSMRDHIVGFRRPDGSISYIDHERDDTMHDRQISEEVERRKEEEPPQTEPPTEPERQVSVADLGSTADGYTDTQKQELADLLQKSNTTSSDVYLQEVERLRAPLRPERGKDGYYSPSEDRVHFKTEKVAVGSSYETPYEVHFHEYAHNIDAINGNVSTSYRDENGRTFDQIITDDWNRYFAKDATLESFEQNCDTSKGGMGAEGWTRSALRDWANREGLSYDDDRYSALREELRECRSEYAIRGFVHDHIDILQDVSYSEYMGKGPILDFCSEIKSRYTMIERGNLSDMFERFSVNHGGPAYPFGVGHGKEYTKRDWALSKETFAEMFASEVANPTSLEITKQYLPNAYKAYTEMIGGLKK